MTKRTKIVKTPTLKAGLEHTKNMVRDVYTITIRRPSEMTIENCQKKIRNAIFDCFNEAENIHVTRAEI